MKLTGNKDTDRLVLLKLKDNKDFLNYCIALGKKVCNDDFFHTRLMKTYPYILKYNTENKSWRQYFLIVTYYIAKLKEDFDYDYRKGMEVPPEKIYLEKWLAYRSSYDDNAIDNAIQRNRADIVKLILKYKKNLTIYKSLHLTNPSIIKLILQNNDKIANFWIRPTVIDTAIKYKRKDILQLIEEKLSDTKYFPSYDKEDLFLQLDIANNNITIIQFLIENTSDESLEKLLEEILVFAAKYGNLDIFKLADEKSYQRYNYNKLYDRLYIFAIQNNHLNIIQYLVEKKGVIPKEAGLKYAIEQGYTDIVEYLESYFNS